MIVCQAVSPSHHEASEVIVPDSDDERSEREGVVPELMIGLTPMPTQEDAEDTGASQPKYKRLTFHTREGNGNRL